MPGPRPRVLALESTPSGAPDLLRLGATSESSPWALVWTGDLLGRDGVARAQRAAQAAAAMGVRRLVCWSGTLGGNLLDSTPANWTGPGREALRAAVIRLAPALRRLDVALLLRPHARHVASDAPACRLLLDDAAAHALPLRLALEPAALLEPSMLEDAPDHLRRVCDALASEAACVILTNVERCGDGDEAGLAPTPITSGLIAPADLCAACRRGLAQIEEPPPLALLDRDLDAQVEALRAAGYTCD